MDKSVAATIRALSMDSPHDLEVKGEDHLQLTFDNRVQAIFRNIPEGEYRTKALRILFKNPNDVRSGLLSYLDQKTLDYAASRNEMKRDNDYFVDLFLALSDVNEMDLSRNESLLALEKILNTYPDSYLMAKFLMYRTLVSRKPHFSLHIYIRLPEFLRILPDLTRLYLAGIEKSSASVNPDHLQPIPELAISLSEKAASIYRDMQDKVAKLNQRKNTSKLRGKQTD